jgi:hypothetical protein
MPTEFLGESNAFWDNAGFPIRKKINRNLSVRMAGYLHDLVKINTLGGKTKINYYHLSDPGGISWKI